MDKNQALDLALKTLEALQTHGGGVVLMTPECEFNLPKITETIKQARAETERDYKCEIARLTDCLKKANTQAEHFEREWYLRGDEIERLMAHPAPVQEAETLTLQEIWNAAGGNPEINPTKEEVLDALKTLNEICDDVEETDPTKTVEYMWATISEYESDLGFKVSEATKTGWHIARTLVQKEVV
jgi:hypothetical protein